MEVRFRDSYYEQIERDPKYSSNFDARIIKAYRNRINYIRQAVDERDMFALRSWRFEKLKGSRCHQYSIRLNDQWRLILEMEGDAPNKIIVIVQIEDYH